MRVGVAVCAGVSVRVGVGVSVCSGVAVCVGVGVGVGDETPDMSRYRTWEYKPDTSQHKQRH
ncbi:MAG: hypothetical protein F4148_08690 [Caldilineaceae bacterium SB0675_bin_29]|uniref:Uncharacterized protein n=1 Tax=Caldilineaceae bacterium SB0675_bin_29 TaxID=2605266 RepID=A0A6B1G0D2_9CHLR|nr:hypothetical protein [Caldilineaceae bacterium SB0675_bin_29]